MIGPWVLCGTKHCGKSTQGRLLAEYLNWTFFDTDILVEERYFSNMGERASCREIFLTHGEDFFRRLEAETIGELSRQISRNRKLVIALGGGVLANAYLSEEILRSLGHFIYLQVTPEQAFLRITAGGLPPFLANEADPLEKFREICTARAEIFGKYATITVDATTSDIQIIHQNILVGTGLEKK